MTVDSLPGRRGLAETPAVCSTLTGWGHSYLSAGGVSKPGRQYITLLAGMFRCDLEDRGTGGSQATNDELWWPAPSADRTKGRGGWAQVLQDINPIRVAAPYQPDAALPLIHYGHNDLAQHSHDATGNPRAIFRTAMRTIISAVCMVRDFQDNNAAFVLGGTPVWQARYIGIYNNSGSGYQPIPGNNAQFTYTIPPDFEGGTLAFRIIVFPGSDGSISWSGTASNFTPVGGSPTALSGLAYATGASGSQRDSSNCHTVRFTGLLASDAGKTIIGTYSGGAGTQFATPAQQGALTVNGTVGVVTYGYKRVYRTYNGDTIPSTEQTVATGNATLSGANSITIPAGGAWPAGVAAELIIRTTGGANNGGQGIIGVLGAPGAFTDAGINPTAYTANTVNPLTGGAALDGAHMEGFNPYSRAIVVLLNKLPAAGYINGAGDTDVDNYNSEIKTVVAEFPPGALYVADPDVILNKAPALFASDSVHPNDRGAAALAGWLFEEITTWAESWPTKDVAVQAQVMKRITARQMVVQKCYRSNAVAGSGKFGSDAIAEMQYAPGGTLAATNLPANSSASFDYTLDTTVRLIDTAHLAITLEADVGDDIEVELQAMAANTAAAMQLDVAFVTGAAALIRYFSANGGSPTVFATNGAPTLYAPSEAILRPISGRVYATVQLGDLTTVNTIPGQIVVALYGRVGSGTRVLYGGGGVTSPGFSFHARNIGRRNTGSNTS